MNRNPEGAEGMKKTSILLALLALTLTGCDVPVLAARYQIVSAADGKLYRLDTKEGAVHFLTPGSMTRLSESTPVLRVGGYYKMADATDDTKFLKYLGKGQFEKSKFAILETGQNAPSRIRPRE